MGIRTSATNLNCHIKRICSLESHFLKPNMSYMQKTVGVSNNKRQCFIEVVENQAKRTANIIVQKLPVNGFNLELLDELTFTIKELERKNYRGMILSSGLPTVFTGGLDLEEFFRPDEDRFRKFWKSLQVLWKTIYLTPLITIAAINGHAPAAGTVLILSCDHSIMVKGKSNIGLPTIKLGIPVPMWLRKMYMNAIGCHKAEHALKLGKIFLPEEALKVNLVNELVESPSDLLPRCEAQMDEFLEIPEAAFQRTKLNVRKPHVDEMISYEQEEIETQVGNIFKDETQKILRNYFEKVKNKKSSL